MNWKRILKIQELVPKEEQVDIELDREALAESCCEQARLAFVEGFTEINDKQQEKWAGQDGGQELNRLYTNVIHSLDDFTCDQLKDAFKMILNWPHMKMLHVLVRDILNDWEECEGGN